MSALQDFINKNGRLPRLALRFSPLAGGPDVRLTKFLSYSFSSSVVIPVDAFSFSFNNPSLDGPFITHVQEGDYAYLEANGVDIATGRMEVPEVETTVDGGEIISVHGRTLSGQLEDQTSVNALSGQQIYGNLMSISQAVNALLRDTKIPGFNLLDAPSKQYLLATEPGESKLSSLQRFLEPLNCLVWSAPDGKVNIGRPTMAAAVPAVGTLFLDRAKRKANVLSMKSIRASCQIPNEILPIWAGQESVQQRVNKDQLFYNNAQGPARLRQAGMVLPRAVVVSTPQGADAQSLSTVNQYRVSSVAGGFLYQAIAKREIARANMSELMVQAVVPGHFNDDLSAFQVNTKYHIFYPSDNIDEDMYLYQVEYSLSADNGPRTSLLFTRLGTIVSDVRA